MTLSHINGAGVEFWSKIVNTDPCLPNINGSKLPLYEAANQPRTLRYCPTTLVTRLIEAGADPRPQGIFHSIVRNCQLQTVQLAVKHGADLYQISRDGSSTLHYVNDVDKLNYSLRETGNDLLPVLNLFGENALSHVIMLSNESVALSLYSAYIAAGHEDVLNLHNFTRSSGLIQAILEGMYNLAIEMINSDAIIPTPSGGCPTALHHAVIRGIIPIIRLLIAKGVDVNTLDRCGNTALHLAVSWNRPSVVRILIEEGNADVNLTVRGFTPFMHASYRG
ncbi:hypothetical protein PHISCL_03592 [Aspergillus sclerotialis]|uniref:Uncharacterized protein n=1 Tax=Aspergillus sclerotialis TaxID=2070753 RepID=A0A3A2ZLY6_9EURO|nr:hypothetical protein PHISCL_03592 [Aspergillus sclerotialis]